MKSKLKLLDPIAGKKKDFPNIWYTWCNAQKSSRRIYHRLDKFYFNKYYFIPKPLKDGCKIKVHPYTLFDHHPIKIRLLIKRGQRCERKKEGFLLNTRLLWDSDCVDVVKTLRNINL